MTRQAKINWLNKRLAVLDTRRDSIESHNVIELEINAEQIKRVNKQLLELI